MSDVSFERIKIKVSATVALPSPWQKLWRITKRHYGAWWAEIKEVISNWQVYKQQYKETK